ncbi:MAG TPA: electron transfer flavoprotein subunit alpha/FixB family protein [Marmoricola sp.]|nr:electron transfer flavoprotein subunit alpha/FixB family protein [Marmoricola sp.]
MTVLVLVETDAGGVAEVSLETLTVARGIGGVDALVVGGIAEDVVTRLGEYGAGRVVQALGEPFSSYAPAAWAAAVVAAVDDHDVVMAAGTPRGNEVMAHVACRLGTAMAANVVTVDAGAPLRVSRQVLGGAALEEMELTGRAVLTVAGHACEPAPADEPGAASVVPLEPEVAEADLRARVVRTEAGEPDQSGSLKSARVVVGAGRGAGGADGFKELLELADHVGGTIGVSRVVTSLGWRPHHEQVGQTGSRISPDLYIPCGISGAIQHWAGCSGAKTILAVNTDPDAPMVTKAHYAVIGDLHQVVPAVNEEIRRRRA